MQFIPDLRFSMALCDQEKAFRQQRKENIKENMKKLLGPKNSEGLHFTMDVSWKFFKMVLQFNNNFVCAFSQIALKCQDIETEYYFSIFLCKVSVS